MQSANYVSLSIEEKAQFLFVNKEILAPMVRASTTPLRTLALKYNADVVYSEEIVDRSICDCERRINNTLGTIDYVRKASSFSEKQLRKMGSHSSSELNLPVVVRVVPKLECDKLVFQIGTGDPILALEAAQAVEPDVAAIDINMGCPKKFSVCGGMNITVSYTGFLYFAHFFTTSFSFSLLGYIYRDGLGSTEGYESRL